VFNIETVVPFFNFNLADVCSGSPTSPIGKYKVKLLFPSFTYIGYPRLFFKSSVDV